MSTTTVLGATGKTGRPVARRLRERGVDVRPASRSSETRFDWDDERTWAPAVAGASALYLVPPGPGGTVDGLLAAAHDAGVERVVLLSARQPDQPGDGHLPAVEEAVRGWGRAWTVLRPSWFDQNFDEGDFAQGVAAGELRLPVGDGREPFVDTEDIAAVAVAALAEDGHDGRTYELSGPALLTFAEAAAAIAGAAGRPVAHVDVDDEAWAAEMATYGVPDADVTLLLALFGALRGGDNAYLSDGVPEALGRPATSFATYVARVASRGGWRPA